MCQRRTPKIVFDKFHVAKHLGDAVDKEGAPFSARSRRKSVVPA